eukprot:TRINITY_DN14487_c1_g3_i2.p1 TRINITY_DN14487_c1_g3~~TRINITY_DN14487_c1_g3_i2.p1  ORF type:complete len:490 (-),score=53.07 TRINITY_DN14487_c1_g3_i2:29-1462(-)
MYVGYKGKFDSLYAEQVASYSVCFFSELERLAGSYGNRDSKRIGFLQTYLFRDGKTLTFADVPNEGSLLPLPNCFYAMRIKPNWQSDCFAYYLSDIGSEHFSQGAQPKCPVTSYNFSNFYSGNDLLWFKHWSQQYHYGKPPRVLIYTWSTENSFKIFANEAHWKACYAHTHGFDIVFSDVLNVSGVKKPTQSAGGSFLEKWYSDEYMWAWNRDVQRYLFSGQYDYVLNVGADVLFHKLFLDFPVWAYDTGHDITTMDQDYVSYGFNENAVLLKPTDFTREFLDVHFGYRVDFWLQGDNGPWMEAMLVYLGREAEASGRPGYKNICAKHGILTMPSWAFVKQNLEAALQTSTEYSKCFFGELDRLAHKFGHRVSKHLGWSKVRKARDSAEMLPQHNDLLHLDQAVMPWANCFTHVRDHWKDFEQNCFAFHWNGVKSTTHITGMHGEESVAGVKGTCPDPSFDWRSSPWNYANRQKSAI